MAGSFSNLPQHIALIPDGNRRWARNQGLDSEAGHRKGFLEIAPLLLEAIWQREIEIVTLWLFSTENWHRSEAEVSHLMEIFNQFLQALHSISMNRSVRLCHLGRKDRIPANLRATVEAVEQSSQFKTQHLFIFALDYGGKDEMVQAVRQLVQTAVQPEDIDETCLSAHLAPAPDLIIRTSGEHRLSGFMPLQSGYSELYFTPTLFPDMTVAEIDEAIQWFQQRDRRFGK